ncbi:hypothetical protein CDEST_12265 [Colletotrichum destructivum]|uniref:Uncharacterized protein n=1 Tax=Colletotrichum destructivum TaxID=34406 RepID=A0AAX4IVM0_9PEZI|nr:hypothetical protein CDEST_12265 [Colletotrichum destructivum]
MPAENEQQFSVTKAATVGPKKVPQACISAPCTCSPSGILLRDNHHRVRNHSCSYHFYPPRLFFVTACAATLKQVKQSHYSSLPCRASLHRADTRSSPPSTILDWPSSDRMPSLLSFLLPRSLSDLSATSPVHPVPSPVSCSRQPSDRFRLFLIKLHVHLWTLFLFLRKLRCRSNAEKSNQNNRQPHALARRRERERDYGRQLLEGQRRLDTETISFPFNHAKNFYSSAICSDDLAMPVQRSN